MNNSKEILNKYFEYYIMRNEFNETLLFKIADHANIESELFSKYIQTMKFDENIENKNEFDYIAAELPLGMRRTKVEINGNEYKIKQNLSYIIKMLNYLGEDGIGQFIVEPSILFSRDGEKFKELLELLDYYITGIFNMPKNVLQPYTGIRPILITVQRTKIDKIFVGEIEANTFRDLSNNFFELNDTNNIELGELVKWNEFLGFEQYKAKKQMENLETQYNKYKKTPFKKVIKNINVGRTDKSFEKVGNSIYIPKLGTSDPVCSISDLQIKEQNYFQIELKDSISNQYLAAMFKSDLGKLIIEASRAGSTIPHTNKSTLNEMIIPVADMNVQKQIEHTLYKLDILKRAIDKFDNELALNPTTSLKVADKLDQMVGVLEELTDADYVRNIIRKGESKVVEFKETFGYDVRKESREKYIETSSLKTIIGFLNTDGGVLLIGVRDDGNIKGIGDEIRNFSKNKDKFLLHFKNRIKDRIGEEYYPLINYRVTSVDEKLVLIVDCKESEQPCYLDGEDFYVRTNPATDRLTGPKLVQYISNHFKHN